MASKRAGAPKPDISSVDAFKRALLEAKSIAYMSVGSGIYVAGLLERLGLNAALRGKVTRPESEIVSELVARGEAELGIVVITQILTTPGLELVGPLPPEIQSSVTFVRHQHRLESTGRSEGADYVPDRPGRSPRHQEPRHGAADNLTPLTSYLEPAVSQAADSWRSSKSGRVC